MHSSPSRHPGADRGGLVPRSLLVVWLAFLGADRIDLLGGQAEFVLTPFLALTPLLVLMAGFSAVALRRRVTVPRGFRAYLLITLALLSVVLVSTLYSGDPGVSFRRAVLLIAQMLGTLAGALILSETEDATSLLARGAALGLALALVFNIAELWAFLGPLPSILELGPLTVDLGIAAYAGIIPRLSGPVADPNRAGLVFLLYAYLIARWGRRGPVRTTLLILSVGLMILTLSRSNLLAIVVAGAVAIVLEREVRIPRTAALGIVVALALAAAAFLVAPRAGEVLTRSLSPLSERFSLREGSARDHFYLVGRGVDEFVRSPERVAIGVGYGRSFLYLQDVFPGNEYGNFHSLYVSFAAESGALALVSILLLLGIPLFVPGPYRALVAGLVVFNLFYQSGTEPAFWLSLALAWLNRYDGAAGQLEPRPASGPRSNSRL